MQYVRVEEECYLNKMKRRQILQEGEIISITFDYVFTNIFNNPNNIIILENFLSRYLEVPLSKLKGKVKLLNRDLLLEHKRETNKQVDLLVDRDGEKINIEQQNRMSEGIINRNVAFVCKVHARQFKSEEKSYKKMKETLQINLTRNTHEKLKESYYLTNEDGKILTKKRN